MYFEYGIKEIEYLKKKDKKMSFLIDKVGFIKREINPDFFSSVIKNIMGQQISNKALETVWGRFIKEVNPVTPENVLKIEKEKLQSFGMSYKKAEYITDFAKKIADGIFDIDKIFSKSDGEVILELTSLRGVGVWTAEMILLFCMGRKDIFSFNDLGIKNGLKNLYGHKEITKTLFEKYRKRFSPYGSVASLYLWEIAGGLNF